MPNRIIKESICTSEEIDKLTPEQEVFFYRLMVNVDDYGLLDARPKILASKCFPLKSVDTRKIEAWLQALSDNFLIRRYEVDGLPYLAITKWAAHQQIRAKRPKYPPPESGSEIICNQVQANVPVIQSNPIQSESESESESNPTIPAKPIKRATQIPDGFRPNETGVVYADERGVNLSAEVVSFRNFHTAKGSTFKDWQAAWRTWCDKAVEFGRAGKRVAARTSPMNNIGVDDETPEGFSDGFH